ncbi:MAG TPA: ABC transporter permease [Thermoanaerobaculia bacterium]|nr:ABC transporter permease [Thermoanaerobaculia bacterium]
MQGLRMTLRSLLSRDRAETEMDQELRFHIEMETEKNVRRGMTPERARTEALRTFGGVEKTKEQCREERGGRWVEQLLQDLHYGARTLRKQPGYAAVVVLILALGIGANTAIFSAVHGILLRPLPYPQEDRLVILRQSAALAGQEDVHVSPMEMADYRARSRVLADLVEHHTMGFTLLDRGEPQRVQTGVVSWSFFDVLGVKPILGRTFRPEDEKPGAEPVLVLSHEYWRSRGSDPRIVGRAMEMNDKTHTVVGVLPPVPRYPAEDEIYMPTTACPFRASEHAATDREMRMLTAFGRLRSGIPLAQARADLAGVFGQLRAEYPEDYPAEQGFDAALLPLREELVREARPKLLILLGTVGLVLLIVCANVANLTLSRLVQRQRELALRSALGAGRGRIARQLLTESALLALAGGAAGLLLALPALRLLTTFAARFTPRAHEIGVDGTVLLFTVGASLLTGLLAGVAPAFSRHDPTAMLKEGGDRGTAGGKSLRMRNALIVFQLAASFMLLIGAGLTLRSLWELEQVNPGFRPERVTAAGVFLDWNRYDSEERSWGVFNALLERIGSHPGVASVAVGTTYPLNDSVPWNNALLIEGRAPVPGEAAAPVDLRLASAEYFSTLGIPVLKGRAFNEGDHADAPPVVIVNRSLVRRFWGDRDPLGQRISLDQGENWRTVVGVVGDVKQYGLDQEVADEIYRPFAQYSSYTGNVLVRSDLPAATVEKLVRDSLRAIDPQQAVHDVRTLEDVRAESLAPSRLTTTLLAIFAVLALVITAAGIAGILAFSVSQRTHEIGIRMALGAVPGDVRFMILRQAAMLVLPGLALGMAGALVLTRVLTSLLFGVEPTDPVTFVAVSLLLLGVAAVACFVPARRATEIHPMVALRSM